MKRRTLLNLVIFLITIGFLSSSCDQGLSPPLDRYGYGTGGYGNPNCSVPPGNSGYNLFVNPYTQVNPYPGLPGGITQNSGPGSQYNCGAPQGGGGPTGNLGQMPPGAQVSSLQPEAPSGTLDFTVGVLGTMNLAVSGGTPPYTWQLSGTLPSGLTLDSSKGAISGTPQANSAGHYFVDVKVTDARGATAEEGIDFSVTEAAPAKQPPPATGT